MKNWKKCLKVPKANKSKENNMSEGRRRRNVTYGQLESLWEILIRNKSLATGFNKDAQAREKFKQLWREAEQTLNAHGDGAVKDWKDWSKYWSDFKSRMKARVASVRAFHTGTGGGPADKKPLTEIELKFMQILGEDFGAGWPGARVDPFHEEPSTEAGAVPLETPAHTSSSRPATPAVTSWLAAPILLSPTCVSAGLAITSTAETSSSRPATPAVTSWLAAPILLSPTCVSAGLATTSNARMETISGAGATTTTPRPSTSAGSNTNRLARNSAVTLIRRVRRRDPVITQEMARVKLIEISQRREEIDREHLEVMRAVLEELREIKNRLPLPPRDD